MHAPFAPVLHTSTHLRLLDWIATTTTTPHNTMSDFVTLESADGYSFVVPRGVAMASPTLKAMLDEDAAFQEASSRTAHLQYR